MSEFVEHPPVPQLLREKLKDYPEILVDLQESLNRGGRSPGMSKSDLTDEFEAAIWRLRDGLDHYAIDAAKKLRLEEGAGNTEQIAKAKAHKALMFDCAGSVDDCLRELAVFFGR